MKFLCVSYTTVQTMKLLYATSHYLLLFPAKIMHIMHKAFVNMLLTEEDEIVVPSKDIVHRHSSCCHSSINFSMSLDGKSLSSILYLAK